MHENFRQELIRLGLVALAILLFGFLSRAWVLSLLVGLGGYLLWQLRQLYLFEEWLQGVKSSRPALTGIWRQAAERIERIRQRARQRKKRMGRLLHRFHDTLETLPDAAVLLDRDHRVLWFNSAARRLLGLSSASRESRITRVLTGKGLRGWLADGVPRRPLEIVMEGPPPRELELRLLHFGEEQFLLTAHDITELKRVQQVRRDFIANVSHELRTPLTVVKGYLEMLDGDQLPEEAAVAIHASLRQAERMERLVADLLMLSRLELGEEPPATEEVDVPHLLRGLAQDAARLCETHGDHPLDLHLAHDLGLLGSESELASAFGNLLFNALTHTPAGTPVELTWEATGEGARLVVADRGPGIEPEHLERLTERFYRVDKGRSRERGGTGLGLSIVRHVLMRHGGRIEIESTPGEGSRFACLFPAGRVVKLGSSA
ncbi:MAG TPA: phosphate regulon sensor histidine kinase PhoR [Chromatiales bacterium]|nr:phosphate regulon sensor histidine kinase PhoR [Chromatiales bacterium]